MNMEDFIHWWHNVVQGDYIPQDTYEYILEEKFNTELITVI